MMNTTTMASKIQELLTNGMSLEQALADVMKHNPAPKIVDRVTWISELNNLQELRTAIKIAFAKKSKSKGNPEAIARYEKEIKAGQAKLNELLAQVNGDYEKALELGESIEGAAHIFLQKLADSVNERLDKIDNISKAELKRQIQKMNIMFPSKTPENIKSILEVRAKKGDMLVTTTLKKVAWIKTNKIGADGSSTK